MEMARVIGSLSATLKDGSLAGLRLALVQVVDEQGAVVSSTEVAVDTQSVGIGELVLLVRGSGSRQAEMTRGVAADLTIVAIVDDVRLAPPDAAGVAVAAVPAAPRAANKKPSSRATTRATGKS